MRLLVAKRDALAKSLSAEELGFAQKMIAEDAALVPVNPRQFGPADSKIGTSRGWYIWKSFNPETREVCVLAQRAVQALEVQVASVDIVHTPAGPKILEVNSGIMMESLARHHPDGRAMAYRFYDRILCASLGIGAEAPL